MTMQTPLRRIALEVMLALACGGIVGLAGNSISKNGLELGRDYFAGLAERSPSPGSTATAPPTSTRPVASAPAGDAAANAAVAATEARLRADGFEPARREQVKTWFDDPDQETVFVDARNDEHYLAGHIPRAWQFDHYHPDRYVNEVLPQATASGRVLVYCYGKDCVDSELVAEDLANLGIPKSMIVVYVGGFSDWATAGLPVERGARGSGNIAPGTEADGD